MKELIRLLAMGIILYSCSKKESTVNRTSGEAYLKFKIDGEQEEFTGNAPVLFGAGTGAQGVIAGKMMFSPGTGYIINAYMTGKTISISILTDSLYTGQYRAYFGATNWGDVNRGYFALKNDLQIFNISITRYTSGTLDGNFSGKLYEEITNPDSIAIAEGEFKNVRVRY